MPGNLKISGASTVDGTVIISGNINSEAAVVEKYAVWLRKQENE